MPTLDCRSLRLLLTALRWLDCFDEGLAVWVGRRLGIYWFVVVRPKVATFRGLMRCSPMTTTTFVVEVEPWTS